jgi:ribosomal protein L3
VLPANLERVGAEVVNSGTVSTAATASDKLEALLNGLKKAASDGLSAVTAAGATNGRGYDGRWQRYRCRVRHGSIRH